MDLATDDELFLRAPPAAQDLAALAAAVSGGPLPPLALARPPWRAIRSSARRDLRKNFTPGTCYRVGTVSTTSRS